MARRSITIPFGMASILFTLAVMIIWPYAATAEQIHFTISLSEKQVRVSGSSGPVDISVDEDGYFQLSDEGLPALPVRIINILLPQGEKVESFGFTSPGRQFLARDVLVKNASRPTAEDGTKGSNLPFFPDYVEGSAFPPALGRYLGTGYLRGYAIASFLVAPLRYNKSSLYLNDEINLQVVTSASTGEEGIAIRQRFRDGFRESCRQVISSMVLNPEVIDLYHFDEVHVAREKGGFNPTSAPSLEGSPVDYLIITSDALKDEYQRLANWKTMKGVPTVVRTIEWIEANYRNGVDLPETIRFFIRDAYEKWGITWVLLGGDTDVIPARFAISRFYQGGTEVPSDMYFACLDGTWNDTHDRFWGEGFYYVELDNPDLYAEVYLGRLPTSNISDVTNMVNKIRSYETPFFRDYGDKVLLLAEVLFPVDWQEGQPISLNGADLSEYLYTFSMQNHPLNVTRAYETYTLFSGAVPESRQAAIDSMNAGMNIVNHIGHGFRFNLSVADGSILNTDADILTNQDRFFLLYMLNCTAAAYDYYCLAEHFMRNQNGGAVSIIGANRSAFPNASSYYMNDFYDLLFNQDVVHIAETFTRSRLSRTPSASAADNVDLWTHYIYTILSDPEMPLWTGQIDTLDVFHVANVGLGENTILVNVTVGGLPVDSAYVCLYKGEDDYRHASTNTLGNATFNFTCEQPGSISVVVTGRNHARHLSYITVDPSANAYIAFSNLTADDDQIGASFGNGDGVINAGETIDFTLSLINNGGSPKDTVWCILRSSNPLVTVEDSIAGTGSIGVGEVKAASDPLRVAFSPGITDETAIEFTLEIHDTLGNAWNDAYNKLVHVPVLDLLILEIDDSPPLGDGDGKVEENEEFKLYCKIKNYGTGIASSLTAQLEDLDGAFVFTDSLDSYSDLSPMVSGLNTGGFHILETSTMIEHDLELTITDLFGNTYVDTLELRVPDPPSNLIFDASQGVDRIQVSWQNSITSDVEKYNVYHSLTPGGLYTLVSSDPVDHAVFMDVGLSPSTTYYYVATAVDKSGNESNYSQESSSSTNPPQVEGWPIEMVDWTASSPAIGDIDGDGDLEIVQGNTYLYAWHHDGVELIDGDSDPQSWGILNTYGKDYVAPVTLAKLDSVVGLDIVAVSYTTLEVYCFDYQGSILPGWPQTTETNVRAAAVIADLDGDGEPEIIAVDQTSVIYAWNVDGSEYRDGDNNPGTSGVFFRLPVPPAWHYQVPAICDLDQDNQDEIIIGTFVDSIYAFNENGTQVPGWPVAITNDVVGSVAVGDIDLDNEFEIVAATKNPGLIVLNHDGTTLTGWPQWVPSYIMFNPSPALANITGDDHLEIIVAGSDSKLYAFDYTGANLPGWPIYYSLSTYTESSPIVGDVDGDGFQDIILGDEAKYINAWDASGASIDGFPIAVEDAVRGTPALSDVDGDGDSELIVAGWDKNLYVWDLSGSYDKNLMDWPTFHANVHRNGQIGYAVPTALGNVTFNYRLLGSSVELLWVFPPASLHDFNLLRRAVGDNGSSDFEKIASGLGPDESGMIRFVDPNLEPGKSYVYRLETAGNSVEALETGAIYVPISEPKLMQNYPNPFNPITTIVFYVPEGSAQRVSLKIYNVSGALVKTLIDGVLKPDRYEFTWNGRNNRGEPAGSGVYFYQLKEKRFEATKKMLLLK